MPEKAIHKHIGAFALRSLQFARTDGLGGRCITGPAFTKLFERLQDRLEDGRTECTFLAGCSPDLGSFGHAARWPG